MHISDQSYIYDSGVNRIGLINWLKKHRSTILKIWYKQQLSPQIIKRYNLQGIPTLNFDWVEKYFLAPLFELLIANVKTNSTHSYYYDVYLDERLRYAPYLSSYSNRVEYFREILALEEKLIIEKLRPNEKIQNEFKSFWYNLHASLLENTRGEPIRLLAIGDCLMNELRVFLTKQCRKEGIELDVRFLYFSAPQKTELATSQVLNYLEKNPVDMIALSFFTFRGLPFYSMLIDEGERLTPDEIKRYSNQMLGFVKQFLDDLRKVTKIPFLIHNASGLPLSRGRKYFPLVSPLSKSQRKVLGFLNEGIEEIAGASENTFLIDERQLVEFKGYRICEGKLFSRFEFRNAQFHTSRLGLYLSEIYKHILLSYEQLHKTKVFLLDFDETLWKGVMADGPVEQHVDIQNLLKRIKTAGILLVGVSKNDPKNIRWEEMVLQPSDFVLLKLNWNLKIQSIEEVARELNLGYDSFLFIDDNPVERELVKNHFPSVRTLDPSDRNTWMSIERMLKFPNTSETEEAKRRTEMYIEQAQRSEILNSGFDYPSMMAMLDLKVRFGVASKKNIDRIFELINRTNQFNTTSIRYNKSELLSFLTGDSRRIYKVQLSDKFGDLGIVGVVVIERNGDAAIFDSFVMSCRAMGFGLEQLMVRLILEGEGDCKRFVGRFIPTERNTPAADLFSKNGFKENGRNEWALLKQDIWPEKPSWFTVIYE